MIRLAIIEDNFAYRKALQLYIGKIEEIEIIYVDSSVTDLLINTIPAPDVIIMDIDLGKESGIENVQKLKKVYPASGIFMLTVFEDEEKIFQSIKAGALGYLLKKDVPEKIVEAIRNVYKGESVINGQIARKILEYFSKPQPVAALNLDIYNLTKREKEILMLLISGLSYKEIAAQCFISIDTLNSHIRKIYSKLNVHSRSEIAARFR